MKKIKVTNIETLHLEKQRLKELCKQKEELLNQKLEYIQDNFGILIIESILPVNTAQKSKIANGLEIVNSLISQFIPSFADKIKGSGKWIKLIEMVVSTIAYRFFGEKKA